MSKGSIYLAGGVFGLNDHDATWWRGIAKQRLEAAGYDIHDPMERDYRGLELGNERAIVEADIGQISSARLVLASCLSPSWGTAMELRVAWDFSIPVFSVVSFAKPLSPWLRYHSMKLFIDLGAAVEEIILRGIPKHPKCVVRTTHAEMFDGDGYLLPEFQNPPVRYTGRR